MDEETNIAQTTGNEETGSSEDQVTETNQAETRTFTQEDVDKIIQNRLKQVEKKYDGIDVDEYRQLKQQQADEHRKSMMKREKFEELLSQQKAEYDAKIDALTTDLHKTHIDGALLNSAAKHGAVNPEHLASLLRSNIRLGESNQVEVLDADGQVRYNTETAEALTVDAAVQEFLNQNPYFRAAQPAGTGSTGNSTPAASREVKLSDLDMNDPEHRKIYKSKFDVGQNRSFLNK